MAPRIAKIMFGPVSNAAQRLPPTCRLLGSGFLLTLHQCGHVYVGKADDLLTKMHSVMHAHNIKVNKAALQKIIILIRSLPLHGISGKVMYRNCNLYLLKYVCEGLKCTDSDQCV